MLLRDSDGFIVFCLVIVLLYDCLACFVDGWCLWFGSLWFAFASWFGLCLIAVLFDSDVGCG